MASPIIRGTRGVKEITSKDVDVVDEHIEIFIDSTFQNIRYKVNYKLHSSQAGKSIPLLFIAFGAYDSNGKDFIVHCDGKHIPAQSIPYDWFSDTPDKFSNFNELWLYDNRTPNEALIKERDSTCKVIGTYHIHDMNYFEVDLDTGFHNVTIEYIGRPTIDRNEWINKYQIDYALSPIKYWKSHSNIKISVHSEVPLNHLNFNYPTQIQGSHEATCIIDSISNSNYSIKYAPKINSSALNLIQFGQDKMTLIFFVLASLIHCLLLWGYRKIFNHKYSIALIFGSILVPFFTLYFRMYTFDLIDNDIGMHAAKFHGYTFFIFILYPIILPVYWVILWQIDNLIKRSIKKKVKA